MEKLERKESESMKSQKPASAYQLALCALFTALITVGAYIHIPLPLGDYYTLQLLFVLLAGLLLGAKQGMIATAVYVALGLFGLPVFAGGGGPGYVLNPSFGYLLGFIAGAWISGLLVQRLQPVSLKHMLTACYAALFFVYAFGLPYKYFMLNNYLNTPVTWPVILAACFPIDIPCDIVLCFFCACLANKLYPAANRILRAVPAK